MNKPLLKVGDVLPGDGRPRPIALAREIVSVQDIEIGELHSMDAWWVARVASGSEFTARRALVAEGFEAWFPTYKHYKPYPLAKISSKTRHKIKNKIEVKTCALYEGYVLLRPLFGNFQVSELYRLQGCIGLCVYCDPVTGIARPVTFPDYKVELLRLREADGVEDKYSGVSPRKVMTGTLCPDLRTQRQWSFKGRIVGRLDESFRRSLFIDRGDRVLRVVTAPPVVSDKSEPG